MVRHDNRESERWNARERERESEKVRVVRGVFHSGAGVPKRAYNFQTVDSI